MDEVLSGGIAGGSKNQTRPVQTVEIQALGHTLTWWRVAWTRLEFVERRQPRGGPETADVVAQVLKDLKEDAVLLT